MVNSSTTPQRGRYIGSGSCQVLHGLNTLHCWLLESLGHGSAFIRYGIPGDVSPGIIGIVSATKMPSAFPQWALKRSLCCPHHNVGLPFSLPGSAVQCGGNQITSLPCGTGVGCSMVFSEALGSANTGATVAEGEIASGWSWAKASVGNQSRPLRVS